MLFSKLKDEKRICSQEALKAELVNHRIQIFTRGGIVKRERRIQKDEVIGFKSGGREGFYR